MSLVMDGVVFVYRTCYKMHVPTSTAASMLENGVTRGDIMPHKADNCLH